MGVMNEGTTNRMRGNVVRDETISPGSARWNILAFKATIVGIDGAIRDNVVTKKHLDAR